MKTNPLLHPHGIKRMCDTCSDWDRGVCHSDKHSSSVYPRSLIELTDMLVHDCSDTANFITGPSYGCVHHTGPELKRRAEEGASKQGRSLGNFVRRAIELAIVEELNRDKAWGINPGRYSTRTGLGVKAGGRHDEI